MANKNNIRSIRFTDEMASIIEQQAGRNFTEKFEALVTRCMWELPAKEKELDKVQQAIEYERRRLQELRVLVGKLQDTAKNLQWSAETLQRQIDEAAKKWS